ncbi:peptidoglycan recognition family protein [uncultured Phascolarctobacterium sp.]|uniref:peptidoglycan recognition protein family protein n=1 Tax=uncultured Phascolarctobacterium sp. TaxID=512296 RepID=UPI0025FFBF72|nr:peptidoglycan recognition family protein [uncultured Phascolarctobacterium sp.]
MIVAGPPEISLPELEGLACRARGQIQRLYLHWTAGRYGQFFSDYHLNIGGGGEIFQTCVSLTERKAHTWRRNTGAVGIALCCAYGAFLDADGEPVYPQGFEPTQAQVAKLAAVIAVLCKGMGLPPDAAHVATHCEVAELDGYGPGSGDADLRWDLAWLPDARGILQPGGRLLRQLAREYEEVKNTTKGGEIYVR